MEEALDQLQLPYWYGFDSESARWAKSAEQVKLADETALPVLKLHGSMNWARPSDAGPMQIFKSYDEVRNYNLVPELIPPTWKKVFEKQLEAVWQTAIRKLNSATRIVIIGFSMPATDLHFKYLMAAGLRSNASLRQILFVNPEATVLEAKARTLLRNAYIDTKTIDFDPYRLDVFTQGHPAKLGQIGRRWEQSVSGYDLHHY